MGVRVLLGRLTSLALLLSKIPFSVPKRDIIDGCCWCAGRMAGWRNQESRPRIRGKIRVISHSRREGVMIRSPRPKCVGEDSQPLFAEVTSLKTTGGVL